MSLVFHTFKTAHDYLLFDTNTNSVIVLDENAYLQLSELEKGITPENSDIVKEYQAKGFLNEVNITEIRHQDDIYLETLLC